MLYCSLQLGKDSESQYKYTTYGLNRSFDKKKPDWLALLSDECWRYLWFIFNLLLLEKYEKKEYLMTERDGIDINMDM